ncbi:HEAT repeat-containing protein [Cavenderia fasciculata]|uniref:HEAT repeat-containing protein n=1 Tax=Cavenderia fasciculata TaxID=261658 RepID=F4PQ36_CACFS|nr:HEAT repeat-containing protein [Cavenderia fasciculata]EGG22499.1 HEAT repeat-containing protein [Cavenderia fasciculata]|eukprot:XP_004360350.1 HEAT repeat-containing protein [Cavenderia fasciculata]
MSVTADTVKRDTEDVVNGSSSAANQETDDNNNSNNVESLDEQQQQQQEAEALDDEEDQIASIYQALQSPTLRDKRSTLEKLRSSTSPVLDSSNNSNISTTSSTTSTATPQNIVQHASEITETSLATLAVTRDSRIVQVVLDTVRSVLDTVAHAPEGADKDAAVTAIVNNIVAQAKKQVKPDSSLKFPYISHLLTVSIIVLERLHRALKVDQINILISNQSKLLNLLSLSQISHAESSLIHTLINNRPVYEFYNNYVNNTSDALSSVQTLYFIGILIKYDVAKRQLVNTKDIYLNYYNKVILNSPQPLSIENHLYFEPLFKIMDLNDFTNIILPTISRVIKRSPDEITMILTTILEKSNFDITNLTKSQITPLLIPVLQIASIQKNLLKRVFTAISQKTKDIKIFTSSVEDILKVLSSPGNINLKLNTLYALKALSNNTFELNEKLNISKIIVPIVSTYLEKEFQKINRIQGFKTIGECLKSDEDAIKTQAINALSTSFSSKVDAKKYEKKLTAINTSFTEPLLTILKNIKNPATCETGTTAAVANYIISLATTPTVGAKLLADKNIVPLIYGQQSFLHQIGFLNRVAKEDTVPAVIAKAIGQIKSFASVKGGDKFVYQSALQLALHPGNWHVRRQAIASLRTLVKENSELTNVFFVEYVKLVDTKQQPQNPTQQPLTQSHYNIILKAILSPSLDAKHYATLALVSNHPTVGRVWPQCMNRIGKTSIDMLKSDTLRELVAHLFGSAGLLNKKNPLYQQAFINTIAAFTTFNIAPVIEQFIANFIKAFNHVSTLKMFTPLQLAILAHPEGDLYEEHKTAVQTSTSSERRGKAPKAKSAEEQKEEDFKRRLEEKKKKESGEEERLAKERLKAIQEQTVVRRDVQQSIEVVHVVLRALESMVRASPRFVGEFIGPVYLNLLDLFKNDFVYEAAKSVYSSLALTIPHRFKIGQYYAQQSTYLIDNILFHPVMSDMQVLSAIQRTLGHLKELSQRELLPASAFNFFWPIVKNGLEKTISLTIQELSMEITERHSVPQSTQMYPRGSMISALIIVVSTSPRLEEKAKRSIFNVIGGVEETDIKELMEGLISPHHQVRLISLQGLERIPSIHSPSFPWEDHYIAKLWFAKFDAEVTTSQLAEKIWNGTNLQMTQDYLSAMKDSLYNTSAEVRTINADALKAVAGLFPATIRQDAFDVLFPRFEECIPDEIRDTKALQKVRISIATALSGLGAAVLSADDMRHVFDWIIQYGLSDVREDIQQEFVATGCKIIASDKGKLYSNELLKIFEEFLARPDTGSADQDTVRASVVVYMGSLAKHMEPTNPRVATIIDSIVQALATPSEPVQMSVSKCITQLLQHFKKQGERLIPILFNNIKMSQDYAERRGNAFGLAGAIKGLGISSLKQYDIVATLTSYVDDKKHPYTRQGALFAFECICSTLGRIFEPYVIQILPKLLVCFGDSSEDVRKACAETARVIMSQLSGHGVKIVLPVLLKSLDDRQWRTKEGSIELLGAMAFCAPKQLSSCLPTIVPKLTNVLNDTHIKVHQAARIALQHIGSVIRNPEIQIHVPLVLKTFDDPDIYSRELLENLLNTNYIHTIDAASLSLIMPILERTLKERSSEVKKMTCQIVGNLCSLTEPKEIVPYISVLMPTLKQVLLDPIPEVRAICARALGLLVRGMGEDNFVDLVPWLLETVKSDQGPVERSGAAQGLSEVLAALDISRFNSLIGELITMCNSTRPHVREGVLSMFIFLPISLGNLFLPYLPRVLPQVLKGLADDHEPVREVCMRCGNSIINQFAVNGIEVIVPSLERVLFHENWRIRLSAVQLFGDLLYRLSGMPPQAIAAAAAGSSTNTPVEEEKPQEPSPVLKGRKGRKNAVQEEEEVESSNSPVLRADIYKILGKERLDRILSSLYMMRFDVNSSVRQKVLLIWKFVVNNTPKTLREILPSLVEMIIQSIGSSNIEKRQIAAKTLGDVVSKLGDRILPEILPILQRGLDSEEEETRQGVCIGLTEVISSARSLLLPFLSAVVGCINKALCDELVEVREAAARAFDQLYATFGSKAGNEILPPLIQLLDSRDPIVASNALDGLRQIVLVKSSIVLPFVIPKLLAKPISTSNVQALSALASDASQGLFNHLPTIVSTLIEAFTSEHIANKKEIKEAASKICKSIDSTGLEILIPLLIEQTEVRLPAIRLGACELIGDFCATTSLDIEDQVEGLLEGLIKLLDDPDKAVQVAANQAMALVTKTVRKDNLQFLQVVHSGVEALVDELVDEDALISGFCIPKGLACVLPLLLNGLRYGSADQRELATTTMQTIIKHTSQDIVKGSVMEITGPLILTIGDKFPWGVKSAILETLSLLITKCPASMKIFLHQLQHTFIKALGDAHKVVRNNAASALGLLMTLSPSVDQLVGSLIVGLTTADSTSQEVKLQALQSIFDKKPKIDQANLDKCLATVVEFLYQPAEELRVLGAQVLGAASKSFVSIDTLVAFVKTSLLSASGTAGVRYGKSLALNEIIKVSGQSLIAQGSLNQAIIQTCQSDCKDDKAQIRESSAHLAKSYLLHVPSVASDLLPSVCHLIGDQASSVAITALNVVKSYTKANPQAVIPFLNIIVPPTMNRLKERANLPLKLACERNLVHSLQIFKESYIMDDYLKSIQSDQVLCTQITDYHRRVLIKLAPDSDTESKF